jgi:hypothetical protein
MSKNPKDSRRKSHAFQRWFFFLVISILLGTTAALLPLASPDTLQMQSFEMPNVLRRIIFFTCAFLIALYLLNLIFKTSRRFWRWLISWRPCRAGATRSVDWYRRFEAVRAMSAAAIRDDLGRRHSWSVLHQRMFG